VRNDNPACLEQHFNQGKAMTPMKTLLCAVAGAAMFVSAAAARAAEPLKIGVGIAETGPFAPAAIPVLNVYKMWVDDVNAKGGLDVAGVKRPINLIVYDDQSDFSKEPGIYEKLITSDKVDLLLSPYATPAHFAVVGVLERYRFPMVGSTAASVGLKQVKPGNIWFPTSSMPDAMGPQLVKLMQSVGVKTVAIATLQSPFPQEMLKYTSEALKGSDIKIVASQQYSPEIRDFTSTVTAFKQVKPDATLIFSFPADSVLYMKAAREQGLTSPFQFVLIGPSADFFEKMFGPNLDGIVSIGHWSPSQTKWPKAQPFYDEYSKKFNQAPDYLDVVLGYMSCEITEQAVAKVGLDHDKLRKEISSDTFDTIDGPVKFQGVENISTPAMFLQVQNGHPEIIWPADEETAKFEKKPAWK